MITENIKIPQSHVCKLLSLANPDAALLYLYLQSGNSPEGAEKDLMLNASRLSCAMASLRQQGLVDQARLSRIAAGERPNYSGEDVRKADYDPDFVRLREEVERVLGHVLNTEELKILLGFVRYLGLSSDVIYMLIHYCIARAKRQGKIRNPSLRTIEKEAYLWAEQGIDTLEEANAYIQAQEVRTSRLSRLMQILQIRGRQLTPAEERYANSWMEMGMDDQMIAMAYERTCLNTGGLNWSYMNKILQRWHEAGLRSAEEVRSGDQKNTVPKGASGQLGDAELEAIQQLMRRREA